MKQCTQSSTLRLSCESHRILGRYATQMGMGKADVVRLALSAFSSVGESQRQKQIITMNCRKEKAKEANKPFSLLLSEAHCQILSTYRTQHKLTLSKLANMILLWFNEVALDEVNYSKGNIANVGAPIKEIKGKENIEKSIADEVLQLIVAFDSIRKIAGSTSEGYLAFETMVGNIMTKYGGLMKLMERLVDTKNALRRKGNNNKDESFVPWCNKCEAISECECPTCHTPVIKIITRAEAESKLRKIQHDNYEKQPGRSK